MGFSDPILGGETRTGQDPIDGLVSVLDGADVRGVQTATSALPA